MMDVPPEEEGAAKMVILGAQWKTSTQSSGNYRRTPPRHSGSKSNQSGGEAPDSPFAITKEMLDRQHAEDTATYFGQHDGFHTNAG
jgi:hypothetical protein